jgi:predicted amidohydrolase YtcJ
MDPNCPVAGAAAARDGKIIAVGERGVCAAALEKGYQPVDLQGCSLLPGFIDTHLHPVLLIFYALNCDLGSAKSMGDLQHGLQEALARKSSASWLIGLNFDEQNIREKRVPDRHAG